MTGVAILDVEGAGVADGLLPVVGLTAFATGIAGFEPAGVFAGAGVALGFPAGGGKSGASDSGVAKVSGVLRSTIKFTVSSSFFANSTWSR